MTTATAPEKTIAPSEHECSALGALLSYLVPGLGQIYQGRVAKGVLFLVCLYGLFFYGMYLGSWNNVYLNVLHVDGSVEGKARDATSFFTDHNGSGSLWYR